ncbi:alpha/beta hydrolase [Corynebacterium propinquum]|uniref:Alpha/beta hydrolase-fold protein n=1 Tax=Corynebacterium propinquum TaxID=43769 RepID=A0ABT7G4D6_9CORY|nr:alpha/beta hydrolase-fold protein [Corynebacterium propinquum]MDK4234450.1 alpha/beta hydrolase-fold protein [Corynebacterium propinquum]MDK4258783.1 alpha/beta hydrolase-fold protein [Corynebacterium propinquum]MDK4282149.1 alpha/beta hydrolase-fold protein [Corynebacterium propinquum]MDK4299479.1 alpha/beta hydrolase-fold protein [Corynebacterium propinquum]MDK4301607.1 alpha/beta hydrolase-fold protein [Corynebacterium propinquum]
MPSSLSRRAAALALTAAFSLPAAAAVSSTVTTPQAHAQLGSSDTSSRIAYDGSSEPMAEWSKDPAVQGHVLDVIQFFQNDTPWHQLPMWNLWGEQTPYTIDKEQDFAQPRLINREPDERFDVERLYVESPAMRRVVQVQVQYPKDRETAAPMLYLLDGVSAPRQSGWLRKGDVQGTMANEHVTTIMPVEAGGTNYTDWNDTDPYLGRAKWETFLTQELPGVLEQQTGIPFNGERYIGGLSMGGSAAIRLANLHPELYSGTFSVSGCYSSTSTAGRAYFNLASRVMGGNPDLMWGPGTTPERLRNDVVADPKGIASMPLYIYSANGHAAERDIDLARSEGITTFFGNITLEKLTNQCSTELEQSMQEKRMMHDRVEFDFAPTGIHDWPYYKQQLPVAWASITQGKYTYPTPGE